MKDKILSTILLATIALATTSEVVSTVDPLLQSLLSDPTWVVDAINSAEPTAWASSYEYDLAFAESVGLAMAEGTMPAWYNKLPESVPEFDSTRGAAIRSYEITHAAAQDTATATATAATTAAVSTATSTSSSSNGAHSVSNNGVLMAVAGAAGILGLGV